MSLTSYQHDDFLSHEAPVQTGSGASALRSGGPQLFRLTVKRLLVGSTAEALIFFTLL